MTVTSNFQYTFFKITGIVLIALSLFVGLYVGTWIMFIGGWIDVITTIIAMMNSKAASISTLGYGIGKIVLAGPVGVGLGYLCFLFGLTLVTSRKKLK